VSPIIVGPQEGNGFRIEQVWMAVAVHEDSDESIPAALMGGMVQVPLIISDMKRMHWLRKAAKSVAEASGKQVRIVRLSLRTDLETIEP
jgi:hypothetical protein